MLSEVLAVYGAHMGPLALSAVWRLSVDPLLGWEVSVKHPQKNTSHFMLYISIDEKLEVYGLCMPLVIS